MTGPQTEAPVLVTLADEPGRLAALDRYAVLDTEAETSFDRITALVRTVLKMPMVAVSLIDQHRQWFKSRQGLNVQSMDRHVSFCTHTIRTQAPLVIPDATLDPRFVDNPLVIGTPFIRSYAGAPLSTPDGYNVGALCAMDIVPREFDAAQIEILLSFAALVVDELELRTIAQTDFLTGAISRRGFIHELDQALARHHRRAEPQTLLMLDLDHFKAINDTLGHSVGDQVLVAVASACGQVGRGEDAFGRVGGEEFAILLAGTGVENGLQAAERFRAAIAGVVVPGHPDLHVTASFGVTAIEAGDDATIWMARADRALYVAKESGRNRCCVG